MLTIIRAFCQKDVVFVLVVTTMFKPVHLKTYTYNNKTCLSLQIVRIDFKCTEGIKIAAEF